MTIGTLFTMPQMRRQRHLIALYIFICFACFVKPSLTSYAADAPASLAEANQDFQRAMQIWGNGQSSEVEALLNHTLAIRQEQLGPDDPKVAAVIERLGALSYNRGRYSEAEQRFRKALDIDRKALGERNIATIYLMGDLGAAIREQRRCHEAQDIVEHSLALYREVLPPNDPLMAGRLNNLGRIYLCERRYADARGAVRESLGIYTVRSNSAGMRNDQGLLERIDNAERNTHRLAAWGLALGAGALMFFVVLLTCNLWSEHRHIAIPTNRPVIVRIAGIAAAVGLFGSVGILCAFAIDFVVLDLIPSMVGDRYTVQNLGKLGFFVGIWLSMIMLQIFSNIGRRAIGLPTHPIVYFHWSALQPRLPLQEHRAGFDSPLIENSANSPPWFAAMEYYAIILNKTYKVFVSDAMLCGAKVRGLVSNPASLSPQMANQAFWVQTRSAQIYEHIAVTSEDFVKVNSANFQIRWREIASIEYRAGRKWGMGNVPHSGRLVIRLRSGKSRELILLGEQNGEALKARLDQLVNTDSASAAAQ